eukprot:31177-Pelagococcus_subviridis.AAC.7
MNTSTSTGSPPSEGARLPARLAHASAGSNVSPIGRDPFAGSSSFSGRKCNRSGCVHQVHVERLVDGRSARVRGHQPAVHELSPVEVDEVHHDVQPPGDERSKRDVHLRERVRRQRQAIGRHLHFVRMRRKRGDAARRFPAGNDDAAVRRLPDERGHVRALRRVHVHPPRRRKPAEVDVRVHAHVEGHRAAAVGCVSGGVGPGRAAAALVPKRDLLRPAPRARGGGGLGRRRRRHRGGDGGIARAHGEAAVPARVARRHAAGG